VTRTSDSGRASSRTVLEAKIRERSMSHEEFAEYATTYARDHGERGTLSVRQLQRLLSPRPDGTPRPRPATRRLLEQIFDTPVDVLLAAPGEEAGADIDGWDRQVSALNRDIAAAQRVGHDAIAQFTIQIDSTRRLDRRFGAAALLDPLRLHLDHIETLLVHATAGETVRALAALLADGHALAAWQALDLGRLTDAWRHSGLACDAARAAQSPALLAHALAERTVILADAGRTADSVELSERARTAGDRSSDLLRSWLAAAHGEALAAHGLQDDSLHAFDDAVRCLPDHVDPDDGEPYITLGPAHLARWRGHALARFGHRDAVPVLVEALAAHDADFTRAEAGIHVDLAAAYLATGDRKSATRHRDRARTVSDAVRSRRQHRRIAALPLV